MAMQELNAQQIQAVSGAGWNDAVKALTGADWSYVKRNLLHGHDDSTLAGLCHGIQVMLTNGFTLISIMMKDDLFFQRVKTEGFLNMLLEASDFHPPSSSPENNG